VGKANKVPSELQLYIMEAGVGWGGVRGWSAFSKHFFQILDWDGIISQRQALQLICIRGEGKVFYLDLPGSLIPGSVSNGPTPSENVKKTFFALCHKISYNVFGYLA
jgi:hypothetical protein